MGGGVQNNSKDYGEHKRPRRDKEILGKKNKAGGTIAQNLKTYKNCSA